VISTCDQKIDNPRTGMMLIPGENFERMCTPDAPSGEFASSDCHGPTLNRRRELARFV
jgi:hypothetical protein